MRVEVIDMEQTKNEAKKYILKKIPLVSKVFQFNSVIVSVALELVSSARCSEMDIVLDLWVSRCV